MRVLFYQSKKPLAYLIRRFTKKKGQDISEVPSHVAIQTLSYVTEATIKGVTFLALPPTEQATGDFYVEVPLGRAKEFLADAWLLQQVGKPYDFWAIIADAIGLALPRPFRISSTTTKRWDCSRLIAGALEQAGISVPAGDEPVSPNDIYLFLKEKGYTKNGDTATA